MNAVRRLRKSGSGGGGDEDAVGAEPGILNERILLLIFESIKWDIQVLCLASSVNRKLRAIANRVLWRELCASRAPRMVSALASGAPSGRIGGGWPALAKLMFFCCGGESTRHSGLSQRLPGHFARASRFSKTSGRSFLSKKCRGDILYVSDPCEHHLGAEQDDLGVYRGVFKGFSSSKTRAFLVRRQVALQDHACPYCRARVWSMTAAQLVPRSAARRLGSQHGKLEYFVCVNGHLHGTCWLVPLSSDDNANSDDDEDDDSDEDSGDGVNGFNVTATDGSTSSNGEEVSGEGYTGTV